MSAPVVTTYYFPNEGCVEQHVRMQSVVVRIVALYGKHPRYPMVLEPLIPVAVQRSILHRGRSPQLIHPRYPWQAFGLVSSLFCFDFCVIMARTTWNILTHVLQRTDGLISLWHVPGDGLAGWECRCLFCSNSCCQFSNVTVAIRASVQIILHISSSLRPRPPFTAPYFL